MLSRSSVFVLETLRLSSSSKLDGILKTFFKTFHRFWK